MSTILEVALAVALCVGGAIYLWFHPSRRQYEPDDLVTIAEFRNPTDANLWKMRLESMGVRCVLQNENVQRLVNPVGAMDLAPIQLQVMGCDVGRAKQVISAS